MKILHIIWWGELGGIALNLLDFVRHYQRGNDSIEVCVVDTRSTFTEGLTEYGVKVTRIGARSGLDLRAFRRLCAFLQQRPFDIVHNHTDTYFVVLALLLAAPNAAKICQEHDAFHLHTVRRSLYYRIFGRVYDRFVAVSDRTASDLAWAGVPPDKIVTITNPVDGTIFNPGMSREDARTALGIRGPFRVVGTACRFAPEKDLPLFLDVASRIASRTTDVTFLMVGSGVESDSLLRRVRQLGLDGRVLFPGVQTDMNVVWRAIDVYLFTSSAESFSRAILESLAAETPIVAAVPQKGGAIDLIRRGRGILCDEARNPERLTNLVLQLLDSPQDRLELGRNGRSWAIRNYDVSIWARAFRCLYESLRPVT